MLIFFRHEAYTHPDILLDPNASLMAIDERFAVFAICDKDINVYSHTVGPFFYINQFNHCAYLVRIPLEFFIRLASHVGDPPLKTKFVLLSNTGRCGSTLLTQLFEQMPNTVAISEPEVLMEFSQNKTFDDIPNAKRNALLQSCIRLLFKSASQSKNEKDPSEIDSFLIKPKAHGIFIAQDLNYLYPNIKNLYMYRHPVEYVKSVRSVYKSLLHPIVRHIMVYAAFDFDLNEFILRQFGQNFVVQNNLYINKLVKALETLDVERNLEERFSALFCGNMLSMISMSSSNRINNVHVVSYHELKDNTQADMNRILKHCEMELDNNEVQNEEDCFVTRLPENDSQNNSGLSRSNLKSYQTALKDAEISIVDKVLLLCGFPSCDKFPLDSNNFTEVLHLSKQTINNKVQCNGHENQLLISSYDSPEACLKDITSVETSKTMPTAEYKNSPEYEKRQNIPLVTNKSIWLPVNRFF